MTLHLTAAACVAIAGVVATTQAQSSAADIAAERQAFEFLVGTWLSEERIDHVQGTREKGDGRFEFRRAVPGGSIEGRWRFNRGTMGVLTRNPQ